MSRNAPDAILPAASEPLWTVQDVKAFLRCSQSAVYAWAERGEIPCRRVGSLLRFIPTEVRAWVDRNATAAILPIRRPTNRGE